MAVKITVNKKIRIRINGVEYDSPDQLPPEARAIYEKGLQQAKASITLNAEVGTTEQPSVPVQPAIVDPFESGAKRGLPTGVWLSLLAALAWLLFSTLQRAR